MRKRLTSAPTPVGKERPIEASPAPVSPTSTLLVRPGASAMLQASRVQERLQPPASRRALATERVTEGTPRQSAALQDNHAPPQDEAERVQQSLGPGVPMPAPLRFRFQQPFGEDFSDVRLHPESSAAQSMGAAAFTVGRDIAFASGRYQPGTRAGDMLLAHELAHVVQQSGRMPRVQGSGLGTDDYETEADRAAAAAVAGRSSGSLTSTGGLRVQRKDSAPICEPDTAHASFVLDPGLALTSVPRDVATHVAVRPPGASQDDADVQYIAIKRPVHSARRIVVYAVPLMDVYADADAAAASATMCDPMRALPQLLAGDIGYTVSGAFLVLGTSDSYVLTQDAVPEAAGAAAVVLLDTQGGWFLVDAGVQRHGAGEAVDAALGRGIAEQVSAHLPLAILDEVLLAPNAPHGYVLPHLATRIGIRAIRATTEQYEQPHLQDVLRRVAQAEPQMRQWLATQVRAQLDARRSEWEAQQPIAPNESYRQEQWQRWRDAQVQAVLDGLAPPQSLAMTPGHGGILEPVEGVATTAEQGAIVDLTGANWEPDDERILYVYGAGGLSIVSSRGLLMRPTEPPAPRPVPGLRPTGARGPTPVAARPAAPWIGVPAVGKEGLHLVRTNQGMGLLIDAGGSRAFMPETALLRLQTRLGISSIEHMAVTHPHTDHVRNLVDFIQRFRIPASNLVLADSWLQGRSGPLAEAIRVLRTTTNPALRNLGYGSSWTPGRPVGQTGLVRGQVALAGGQTLEFIGMGAEHGRYARAHRQAGARTPRASLADTASLAYFLGNRTTPNRVAVLGDMRGADIIALHDTMETLAPGSFRAAFENVRVVVGFGHHFGPDAGTTPQDVKGLELLMRETLLRTGELTIVVQSTEARALTEPAARGGGPSRLLQFVQGMGARVVLAHEPGAGRPSDVTINTRLQVSARGAGVEVLIGAQAPRQALRRLMELREARRLVQTEPTLAPRLLRLTDMTPEMIERDLNTQIQRLEGLLEELLGRRSIELLEARRATSVTERAMDRFRAERPSRPVETLHQELNAVQGIESRLTPEVRTHLRQAARLGSSVAIEAGISPVPRGVADLLGRLPAEQAQGIRDHYAEMERVVAELGGEEVPPERRLELLARAEGLRTTLHESAQALPEADRGPLRSEIARLEDVIERLKADVVTERQYSRAPSGHLVTTEYRLARVRTGLARGLGVMGQLFGGLMIVHSIEGLDALAQDAGQGELNIPEAALRAAHAAYGINLGVRMITMSRVTTGKFAVLALLDVGSTLAADYQTTEERDIAVARSVISNAVNLICLDVGSKIIAAGIASANPVTGIGLTILGAGVMFAGEPLLRLVGLDGLLVDILSFPPRQVTHVHRKIEELLDQYEMMIGMRTLAMRDPAELRALGAQHPEGLQFEAFQVLHKRARATRQLESEIMEKFEDAYERARTAYFGLRELDILAHRFTRLRFLAKHTSEHDADRGRSAIEERFQRIDRRLDLSAESEATIRSLEQWREIDKKFDECHREIYKSPADMNYDVVLESFQELEWMIQSARYRLAPTAQGEYRYASVLRPGTRARAVYQEELHNREHRMARYIERLAQIGTGTFEPMSASGRRYIFNRYMQERIARYNFQEQQRRLAPIRATAELLAYGDPLANATGVLQRLLQVRAQYDGLVERARGVMPEMTLPETWNDPEQYQRRATAALQTHSTLIRQLRITEMALQSAITHARAQAITGEGSTGQLVEQIRLEIQGAEEAMRRRKFVYGIPLPGEIDERLFERRRMAQPQLTQALGAAGQPVLSREEAAALRSEDLADFGAKIFSPQVQLDRLIEAERNAGVPARAQPSIYRLVGDFDVTDLFVLAIVHRRVSRAENVLVGDIGERTHGQMSGRGHYTGMRVLPLNEAAVRLFGNTESRLVPGYLLEPVPLSELALPARTPPQ